MTVTRRWGEERGRGALLGVQPCLTAAAYASEAAYHAALDACLAAARADGLLDARTVVVFPEFLGAWLVALDEPVADAPTMQAAMTRAILRRLPAFLWHLLLARTADRVRTAAFRMKAARMAEVYSRTFSRLAQAYGVTLVSGSIVLPAPRVADGVVHAGDGPLYNVAALFDPDGRARDALVMKAFPTAEEQTFLSAGTVEALPVFDTPAGRLGVLICADAWFPACYAHLQARGVELLAVPSFTQPEGKWAQPWTGYSGYPEAADVDPADVGRLCQGEAWDRYAMVGRLASCGARAGLLVSLRGRLWEVGTDGALTGVLDGTPFHAPREDGTLLVRLAL
jgi:uncharacterized protein (DUF1778 family)